MFPFWSTVVAKQQCQKECPCFTPHITSPTQPLPLVLYLLSPSICSCWPLCPDTFSIRAHTSISLLDLSSIVSLLWVMSPSISGVTPKPNFEVSQTFLLLQVSP